MVSAIIELQIFGPVHVWLRMAGFRRVYIEQHENYNKGSYRNRYYLMGSHGPQLLSIPLRQGKNEQMPIRQVQISHAEDWRQLHIRTIKAGYGNAPFFEHYMPQLESLLNNADDALFDFSWQAFLWCVDKLKLDTSFVLSSSYGKNHPNFIDLRNTYRPNKEPMDPLPKYAQVFEDRLGFHSNISILDLIFCAGPEAATYVYNNKISVDT